MIDDYVLDNGKVRIAKPDDPSHKEIIYLGRFYWWEEARDYAKEAGYLKQVEDMLCQK